MWVFGGSVRSSCNVGTMFVAAACFVARRITYLSFHLCLSVCALSSPFAPDHGVPVSFSPYPYLFVCCLSWRRCTPYARGGVRGRRGFSFLLLSLLPGWSHTFVGLCCWRGSGERGV